VNLSNDDIQDILSLLDSLPYAEFTLETSRFTLRLRRSAEGDWTQETQVLPRPEPAGPGSKDPAPRAAPAAGPPGEPSPPGQPLAPREPSSPGHPATPGAPSSNTSQSSGVSMAPGAPASPATSRSPAGPPAPSVPSADVRDIVSPLPGTFYRSPQPGAAPFIAVGGTVGPGTVVAIIETMKLMNPVYAGTAGTVTQICLDDGQFAEQGTVLMRIAG
jgi:acetyl-CoA carboxylase biotin carboxyl carrier protein